MSEKTLFHVDLKIPSQELLACHEPPITNPKSPATDEEIKRELNLYSASQQAQERLLDFWIKPALRCITQAEKIAEMVSQCGDNCVIRITLERP